ncbi:MAG: murein biosynthesis integral membrane protein MurJ [Chloroflexota bacterium]|nr:murein biosynthesis integral membrane protein MurJ [Chloroflexota bacterium]
MRRKTPEAMSLKPWGGVAGAAMIVAVGFLGSRLLGVARTVVIADAFGTSDELGAYWVAFRLPDLIFQVLAGATLASAFIPTFARYLAQKDEEESWRLASSVLNLVAATTAVLAIAGVLLAPLLVPLMAPGLGEETGRQDELRSLSVDLTRIMLVSPVLFAISAMISGILNARQHFFLTALAPMLYNLAIILAAVFLSEPWGVQGLAAGVVAGSALHLLVQVPGLTRVGMRYRFQAQWRDAGVREVARLMLPRVAGLAAAQANFLVAIFFASQMSDETISALNYAWLLVMMPLGLFGMAISTAVFPTLAQQASASGGLDRLRGTLFVSLRYILFLTIPASVGLILLREPLVSLLLERGEFTAAATDITASALLFYAIGLFAHSAIEILSRGFYALRDTRTPVGLAVLSMALNLAFSLALKGPLEHDGLALAMSVATIVEASLLFIVFQRRVGGPEAGGLANFLVRTIVATGLMAAVVAVFLVAEDAADPLASHPAWDALARVVGATVLGGGAFLLAALLLRCEEALAFWRRLGLAR